MPSEKEIKVEVFDKSLDEATRAKSAQYAENLLADGEVIAEHSETAESTRAFHQYLVPIALAESGDINNA